LKEKDDFELPMSSMNHSRSAPSMKNAKILMDGLIQAILAGEDLLHCRFHVVINPAPARALEERKCPVGKPCKLALVAAASKPVVILNAKLRDRNL
jgi:hypothetical protein